MDDDVFMILTKEQQTDTPTHYNTENEGTTFYMTPYTYDATVL